MRKASIGIVCRLGGRSPCPLIAPNTRPALARINNDGSNATRRSPPGPVFQWGTRATPSILILCPFLTSSRRGLHQCHLITHLFDASITNMAALVRLNGISVSARRSAFHSRWQHPLAPSPAARFSSAARVAVLYQDLEPPLINGTRKPKKPGGENSRAY